MALGKLQPNPDWQAQTDALPNTPFRANKRGLPFAPGLFATTATLALCAVILTVTLKLWRARWDVPIAYDKDALLCAMLAKTVTENGWYLHNPLLGVPGGLAYYDYPFSDWFQFATLRVISLFTHSWGVVMNVFFVVTFPLTALVSLFTLRRLGIEWPASVVGALLYAFLPYHFLRGEPHLFLSMYWVVPLAVLVIAWVGEGPFSPRRKWFSLAVCISLGLTGYYYAYFAAFLLLLSGAEAALRRRTTAPLLVTLSLVSTIAAMSAVTALPNLAYWHAHGRNALVAQRDPREADYYGLKIAQLLLPVTGHRLPAQAALKDSYNDSMLLINENDDSTLGTLGSLGFVLLIVALIARGTNLFSPLTERFAILNMGAVLLGTIGGLGSLVAFIVLPQIRSYNRISIFIAFFALCAVMQIVDLWYRQTAGRPRARALCLSTLTALLVFGVFDQTSPSFVPRYTQTARQFDSDAAFVRQIERLVPPHAQIYQLPDVPFPESAPVHRMTDYQQFRGYLHSSTLRWSYGGMKGRSYESWRAAASAGDLRAIARAGFQGVWVDGDGYADGGIGIVRQLSAFLRAAPLINASHRLYFFPLGDHTP